MSFNRKFINDEVDFKVFFCVFCYKDWFFIIKYLIMIDFFYVLFYIGCYLLYVIDWICVEFLMLVDDKRLKIDKMEVNVILFY